MMAISKVVPGKIDDLFATAPAPTTSRTNEPSLPSEATFHAAPEARRTGPPQARTDPNLWVPRKLQQARAPLSSHPMSTAQGKRRSLMQPQQLAESHPFFHTLRQWGSQGVPVDCGPDWEWDAVLAAVARGPHRSAMEPENIQLVHEDVQYQVDAGFSKIVLWEDLKKLKPGTLKISPLAVVPQKNRRGRLILDLSFPVYPQRTKANPRPDPMQAGVNGTTVKLAPQEPVREIGNVLRRVLTLLDSADMDEVVMLAKIDLSDGFWRMLVEEDQQYNFAYVMPDPEGSPVRVVVPAALQMGWAESPAYFCTATETARDVIQGLVEAKIELTPHVLEEYMRPEKAAKRSKSDNPVHGTYVYVDDFIGVAVENKEGTLLGRMARSIMHGIHSVFPPPEVTGHTGGKDPVSLKKLEKGDGQWHHLKEILGFIIDGDAKTIRISDAKADDIVMEIRRILKKKRVQLKRYRKIVGKLRHVALIMPGTKGMFSPINRALQGEPSTIGLGKDSEVRAALLDLAVLVQDLCKRPTHVKELIPGDDHYTGYCDACATGAGGVWMSGEAGIRPIVWRVHFDHAISSQVVSDKNPRGRLTNSDLEMAAVLMHYMILQQQVDLRYVRAGVFSDNTPTVAWSKRMADKSQSYTAGRLLRGLAAMQRATRAGPLTVASIAGKTNDMADIASRSYNTAAIVPDSPFLTHFDSRFPLPQDLSWQLVHLTPEKTSLVISTLGGKRLPLQQWMTSCRPKIGIPGLNSVPMHAGTPTSSTQPNQSNNSSSWPSLQGSGAATTVKDVQSKLRPPKQRSVTWRKPSCWLAMQTPDAPTDAKS
jgi:hypothetical protein